MGRHKNTPPMSKEKKEEYLKKDLYFELQWLLRAATHWHVQNELKLEIPGFEVQVLAMDSTFLHARVLFEFFTKETQPNGKGNHYCCDQYLGMGATIISCLYTKNWAGPLHSHVMHLQGRFVPQKLTSLDGSEKDLNMMPVDFAREIVRMWREFASKLGSSTCPDVIGLREVAENVLAEAISNAQPVYTSLQRVAQVQMHEVKPIVW